MVTVTENKITIIDDITFETVAGGVHYYLGMALLLICWGFLKSFFED